MSTRIQIVIGVAAIALITLFLWPIFRGGEPWLIYLLIAFVVGGCLVAVIATRGGRLWPRYALLGIIPGFLLGGVSVGIFVWFTESIEGWRGIIAFVAGIMGAFIGSIIGALIGAIVGVLKEWKGAHG